jgi:hypothetical protein
MPMGPSSSGVAEGREQTEPRVSFVDYSALWRVVATTLGDRDAQHSGTLWILAWQ